MWNYNICVFLCLMRVFVQSKILYKVVCVWFYKDRISYHYFLIYNKMYFIVFSFDIKFNDYTIFVATFTVILFTIWKVK